MKRKGDETVLMNNCSKSLEDVGLRAELNTRIIIVSIILMFVGAVIPPILIEYYEVNLVLAIVIGAAVSILGNLVLFYGQRHKLVKVFSVTVEDKIGLKDEVEVVKIKTKKST